tara:strand:+ start:1874 stop:2290 length:417 start_codon:yes stop_codon:yes gene_type:complete
MNSLEACNLKEADFHKYRIYRIYYLRKFHKLFDSLNISVILLIFILSFISFNAQSEWTKLYSNVKELRSKNNNLVDYISQTEEYFLSEIESKVNIKNANPDDLLYLSKTKNQEKEGFLSSGLKQMISGFKDGLYQKGY